MKYFYLEWLIALRYIRGVIPAAFFSAKSRISFMVMVIAIALLVIVLSVFNGFQSQMKKSIWSQGSHITLYPTTYGGISYKYKEQIQNIKEMPTHFVIEGKEAPELQTLIKDIHGGISSPGILALGAEFQPIEIRAVEYEVDKYGNPAGAFPPIVKYDRQILDKMDKGNYVVIGEEMANYYGLVIGQSIKLYVPRGGVAKKGGEFSVRYFQIAGTFKTNFYETDSMVIYMGLKSGQNFYGIYGGINQINITVKSIKNLHYLVAKLDRELTGFRIDDIESRQKNLLAALQLEKTLISIILFLFVILAAIGMVATIYSQVRNKRQSLGILKALGLSSKSLLFIFTINGLALGVLASLIGGISGIFISLVLENIINGIEFVINKIGMIMEGPLWIQVNLIPRNIYYFDKLPVNIDIHLILLVTFSATVLAGLAGYFPARQAAAMDPVETIRYE